MKNNFYDFPTEAQPVAQPYKHGANTPQLSKEGRLLLEVIGHAKNNSHNRAEALKGKTYHVTSVGRKLSSAYEKIRNSTEYTEEHLLLQRAVRRYLYRNLFVEGRAKDPQLVEELVIELTLGGYIPNNSVTTAQISELDRLIATFYDTYKGMAQLSVPSQHAQTWLLDTLSVECEWIFNDPSYLFAYAHFCHKHVLDKTGGPERSEAAGNDNASDDASFVYYLAVLKNLLKADKATMRAVLTEVYRIPHTSQDLTRFNHRFDVLLSSDELKQANVAINRRGAPLRIIRSAFFDEAKHDASVIHDQSTLLTLIEQKTRRSYLKARQKLNNGIVKSIVFLFITKVLTGVAIEVPVDIWLYGSIIWIPLIINLLAPSLFMIFQRLTIRIPGRRNTLAIREYVQEMLYAEKSGHTYATLQSTRTKSSTSRIFGAVYVISSLFIFGLFVLLLSAWGFNFVQGIIFFIFLSTATFLGFRLSLVVKDLELVSTNHNFLSATRDFIYMPFILLGQWLSGKYTQFNIISILLDFAIELPLKTVLRLARQWVRFLDEKKETLG